MLGLVLSLALAAQAGLPAIDPATTPAKPLASPRASAPSDSICDEPVLLVTSAPAEGWDAYRRAISASGLYQQLGGYELNVAKTSDALVGDAAFAQSIVRFPCRANALAFWTSKVQQDQFALLRGSRQAATLFAAIYPELPLRDDLVGKVGDNSYSAAFNAAPVPESK